MSDKMIPRLIERHMTRTIEAVLENRKLGKDAKWYWTGEEISEEMMGELGDDQFEQLYHEFIEDNFSSGLRKVIWRSLICDDHTPTRFNLADFCFWHYKVQHSCKRCKLLNFMWESLEKELSGPKELKFFKLFYLLSDKKLLDLKTCKNIEELALDTKEYLDENWYFVGTYYALCYLDKFGHLKL